MDNLPKCDANFVSLTPLTFLSRAAAVYTNRTSIIYENTRFTWRQTYDRCCRLASSLRRLNLSKNDVVSVLAPNVPAVLEMHFAVPMAGAVLNTINTRLDAKNIMTILRHSEAKIFFIDCKMVQLASEALWLLKSEITTSMSMPLVIVIDDVDTPTGVRLGELEYEKLIQMGDPDGTAYQIKDEWDPITLNYTSGTTSAPKGVVYSHRGAYLSTLSLILGWEMDFEPVYLWSLPMFHCNGWTFTWGVAARGGTNVCMRNTTAADIYRNIAAHGVTHMCCAPIVFNIILDAKPHERRPISSKVQIFTGGAPPPAPLLKQMQSLGFHITHGYGLTEATGPALVCEWQARWNDLPADDQARLKARQGVSVLTLAGVDVKDRDTDTSVPRDGKAVGEIVLRGSSVMKGYFKDEKATAEAFSGGWYRTGDAGVIHPDGYLEIKDRLKDVIISGGENISSVEVESKLYGHPMVAEAAVVAMPHPVWQESPCAFVALKKSADGRDVGEGEIINYCRKNLPRFMVPKKVVFLPELPKSNNKIQKFKLREMAKNYVAEERKTGKSTEVNSKIPNPKEQEQMPSLALSRL